MVGGVCSSLPPRHSEILVLNHGCRGGIGSESKRYVLSLVQRTERKGDQQKELCRCPEVEVQPGCLPCVLSDLGGSVPPLYTQSSNFHGVFFDSTNGSLNPWGWMSSRNSPFYQMWFFLVSASVFSYPGPLAMLVLGRLRFLSGQFAVAVLNPRIVSKLLKAFSRCLYNE